MVPITAGYYNVTAQPASARLASKSEIVYFSIQKQMPWTFELVGAS